MNFTTTYQTYPLPSHLDPELQTQTVLWRTWTARWPPWYLRTNQDWRWKVFHTGNIVLAKQDSDMFILHYAPWLHPKRAFESCFWLAAQRISIGLSVFLQMLLWSLTRVDSDDAFWVNGRYHAAAKAVKADLCVGYEEHFEWRITSSYLTHKHAVASQISSAAFLFGTVC